ncbi:MAG: S8 family serine peptidase [Planctomycetota bacterium]
MSHSWRQALVFTLAVVLSHVLFADTSLPESARARREFEAQRTTHGRAGVFVEFFESIDSDARDVALESALRTAPSGTLAVETYRYRLSPVSVVVSESVNVFDALAASPAVRRLVPDRVVEGELYDSLATLGVDRVHEAGFRGEGAVIAILDSGIDTTHSAFAGRIIHEKKFLFEGFTIEDEALDVHGHGTHVSGIAAGRGNGVDLPDGVAPDASIVAIQVLDSRNLGFESDYTRGIEHVVEMHEAANGIHIDAVNMSFGGARAFATECSAQNLAMSRAAERARELGIVLFSSAGNLGDVEALTAPACLRDVLAVGATTELDGELEIAEFSARGEMIDYVAPGDSIVSIALGGNVRTRSGSSMASPHLTGFVALLRGANAELTYEEIREVLDTTSTVISYAEREYLLPNGLAAVTMATIPRPQNLRCEFDAQTSTLQLDWNGPPGGAPISEFFVEVFRDGTRATLRTLPAGARSFEFDAGLPGSYTFALRAVSEGIHGLAAHCGTIVHRTVGPFLRGDCNGDRRVDIGDPIRALETLFLGREAPGCVVACDANGDSVNDLSDAVFNLSFLFRGTRSPPRPYPTCGRSAEPELRCRESSCRDA